MNKKMQKAAVAASSLALAVNAQAADWSATMATIDTSGEVTAVQAATGIIIGVTIVIWGARKVLGMFGGR